MATKDPGRQVAIYDPDVPASPEEITGLALKELRKRLTLSPEIISDKDLKEIAFGMLDRGAGPNGHGRSKAPELGEATRGAVLGALQGLAAIAGREIDIQGVEERMVHPERNYPDSVPVPISEEEEDEQEEGKNPYSKLVDQS